MNYVTGTTTSKPTTSRGRTTSRGHYETEQEVPRVDRLTLLWIKHNDETGDETERAGDKCVDAYSIIEQQVNWLELLFQNMSVVLDFSNNLYFPSQLIM